MENKDEEDKLNTENKLNESSEVTNDLNNPEEYKKVRNNLYKRALLGFIMGIAFYQVLLFLVKMLGLY